MKLVNWPASALKLKEMLLNLRAISISKGDRHVADLVDRMRFQFDTVMADVPDPAPPKTRPTRPPVGDGGVTDVPPSMRPTPKVPAGAPK